MNSVKTIIKLILTVFLLVLAGGFSACKEEPKEEPKEEIRKEPEEPKEEPEEPKDALSLVNTKWKIVGIVDVQTDSLAELEPRGCDECYTLTFDTENSFSSYSSSNNLVGEYVIDDYSFLIVSFGGTKRAEIEDGGLYATPFWDKSIRSFALQGDELKLFYNSKKSYLLYKLQKL